VRRYGHGEEHPGHALQRGRHGLRPSEVPDDDVGAEATQISCALVLPTDHDPHRRVLTTQLLEHRTTHAAGTRDENKLAGDHRSISYSSRPIRFHRRAEGDERVCCTRVLGPSTSVGWWILGGRGELTHQHASVGGGKEGTARLPQRWELRQGSSDGRHEP